MVHDNKTIDPEGFLLTDDTWYPKFYFTGKIKSILGTKYWYKNGQLHREDSPAVEWLCGSKAWYKYGKLHREDGPAIEYADGGMAWWRNGVTGLEHFPPELKKKLTRKFLHGT